MKVFLKNTKLVSKMAKKIFLPELLKDVTETGGGYQSSGTSSISNNVIATTRQNTSVRFMFQNGHKYLIGANTATHYSGITSYSTYNIYGATIIEAEYEMVNKVKIVASDPKFNDFPYFGWTLAGAPSSEVKLECYIYDITGYEDSLFKNYTFDDLKNGNVFVV